MSKRLYISLIFSNLVVLKTLSSNHRMYNLYTKFVKILEINSSLKFEIKAKQFYAASQRVL